jgi:hypothetical protein
MLYSAKAFLNTRLDLDIPHPKVMPASMEKNFRIRIHFQVVSFSLIA